MKRLFILLISIGIVMPATGFMVSAAEARPAISAGPHGSIIIYKSGGRGPAHYRRHYGPRYGYRVPPPPFQHFRPHYRPFTPHHGKPPQLHYRR